jgi:hypothetical protein
VARKSPSAQNHATPAADPLLLRVVVDGAWTQTLLNYRTAEVMSEVGVVGSRWKVTRDECCGLRAVALPPPPLWDVASSPPDTAVLPTEVWLWEVLSWLDGALDVH